LVRRGGRTVSGADCEAAVRVPVRLGRSELEVPAALAGPAPVEVEVEVEDRFRGAGFSAASVPVFGAAVVRDRGVAFAPLAPPVPRLRAEVVRFGGRGEASRSSTGGSASRNSAVDAVEAGSGSTRSVIGSR
jgi:hypothetical protein